MMKKVEYKSVADMIRDMTDDNEVIDAVQEALDRQKIVRQLMAMRAANGLSQAEVGKVMGCAQSRISKIESSADSDLRYGDLHQYAEAVGCELTSGLRPKSMTPVDEVKCLAIAINDRLSRMAELAKQDEGIARGVAKFLFETQFNLSMMVGKAAASLPQNADGSPRVRVEVEVGITKTNSPEVDTPEATAAECLTRHEPAGA